MAPEKKDTFFTFLIVAAGLTAMFGMWIFGLL
jgi:hypothetical protein